MKNHISIDISPGACIYAAVALLVLPFPWFAAAICAAVLHESGHMLALRICGVKVAKIAVGVGGAKISTAQSSLIHELICAASGPTVGLFAALLCGQFPRFAFCCFVQSVFNFIPIYPLDGGRVLRCITLLLLGDRFGKYACRIVQAVVFVLFLLMVIVLC